MGRRSPRAGISEQTFYRCAASEREAPRVLLCDNGPEFVGRSLDLWAYQQGALRLLGGGRITMRLGLTGLLVNQKPLEFALAASTGLQQCASVIVQRPAERRVLELTLGRVDGRTARAIKSRKLTTSRYPIGVTLKPGGAPLNGRRPCGTSTRDRS